ncbi:MAG: hypothetical protein EX285_01050 [Thaumarchaeota archaeon]|nr:hypothetical protein [Nitrososphaerota archaeon]
MESSDSFGAQQGYGNKVMNWINEVVKNKNKKEIRVELYGHIIKTSRFGTFEMLRWYGELSVARDLIIKSSKRYKIKTLEGNYKPKSFFSFSIDNRDYAKIHYNGNLIGYLKLTKPRLPGTKWSVSDEKTR